MSSDCCYVYLTYVPSTEAYKISLDVNIFIFHLLQIFSII